MNFLSFFPIMIVLVSGQYKQYLHDPFITQHEGRSFGLFNMLNLNKHVDKTRLANLEATIATLQPQVSSLNSQFATAQASNIPVQSAIQAQVAPLLARLAAAEGSIANIPSVASVKANIAALQTQLEEAQSAATSAQRVATAAKSTAEEAQKDARTAKSDAAAAKTTAEEAQKDATTAKADAAEAKKTAGEAQKTAGEAQKDATTAKADAAEAKKTAGETQKTAGDAQKAAGEAKDKATTAKDDAAAAAAPKCSPIGPSSAKIVSGKCYQVFSNLLNFAAANDVCIAGGGKLAEPLDTDGLWTSLKAAFTKETGTIVSAANTGIWLGFTQGVGVTSATTAFTALSNPGASVATTLFRTAPVVGATVNNAALLDTPNPVAATPFISLDSADATIKRPFVCQY